MTEAAADQYVLQNRQHPQRDFIRCNFCGANNSKYRSHCWKCNEELGA